MEATRLPFDVDVLLDDDRKRATGVHLGVLCKEQCRLVTLEDLAGSAEEYDPSTTAVLFPCETSRPVSEVASSLLKLVVLDCKWSKTSSARCPAIADLPRVHLCFGGEEVESMYWRWHSEGKGRVSTLEAMYYACVEAVRAKGSGGAGAEGGQGLEAIFYFFALQRASILRGAGRRGEGKGPAAGGGGGRGYKRESEGLPWTEHMRGVRREERARGGKKAKEGKEGKPP